MLVSQALLSGTIYPWEALGITRTSPDPLEASFPLKLTSGDSISAILVPMWAVPRLGASG